MKHCFVYMTAKDKEEARTIGKALVRERLAACVNIMDSMNSMYWWEGEVQEDTEAVIIAKTKKSLVEKLVNQVKALHSYECPCVVSWPITAANPDYLAWIARETGFNQDIVV